MAQKRPEYLSYLLRLWRENGATEVTFRLYDVPTDGTALWTQAQNVAVEDGLLNAALDVNPALFDGQALWLGIQVAGDAQELVPRRTPWHFRVFGRSRTRPVPTSSAATAATASGRAWWGQPSAGEGIASIPTR
jgi:hypothetical protein